jgi:hypothetical protein
LSLLSAKTAGISGHNPTTQAESSTSTWYAFAGHVRKDVLVHLFAQKEETYWALPRVRIHPSPPTSPSVVVLTGESPEKRACARDLRLRMDPENVSYRAIRRNQAKVIRSRFCWVHLQDRRDGKDLPGRDASASNPNGRELAETERLFLRAPEEGKTLQPPPGHSARCALPPPRVSGREALGSLERATPSPSSLWCPHRQYRLEFLFESCSNLTALGK